MASNDRRFDVYETTDPATTTFADWNSDADDEINEESEAFNTGYQAAIEHEPKDANPYPAGTWNAKNWDAGWDAE
jgi:ribosome modulation factor